MEGERLVLGGEEGHFCWFFYFLKEVGPEGGLEFAEESGLFEVIVELLSEEDGVSYLRH